MICRKAGEGFETTGEFYKEELLQYGALGHSDHTALENGDGNNRHNAPDRFGLAAWKPAGRLGGDMKCI